jgi:hypothetical protein
MRGPVGTIGEPSVGTNTERVSFDVSTKKEKDTAKGTLKFAYWFGAMTVEQAPFIRAGNSIPAEHTKPTPKRPNLQNPMR